MSASFNLEYSQFETLQRNIERLPNRAEKVINESLKKNVSPILERSIMGLIPVSDRKKQHAKSFKSLSLDNKENLTLTIKPKPKYRYLVFPDLGLGTSKKNEPQMFMEHGVDREVNNSIEKLNKSLIEEINRTLGA